MSRITWELEERTTDDPWIQGTITYTTRTGWTCTCGATMDRRRRKQTVEQRAAAHLIGHHGAPPPLGTDCCCGYIAPATVTTSESYAYGHLRHHERWLIEVWDA